jgi:putative DNA primase/helicase
MINDTTNPLQKRTRDKTLDDIKLYHLRQRDEELAEKYDIWEITLEKEGNTKKKDIRVNRLANMIKDEYSYFFVTMKDTEEIYYYNGSYYQPGGGLIIRQIAERVMGEETNEHRKKQIVGYIRDHYIKDRDLFNPPLHLINLKNGVYNLKTDKLEEHSPDHYFITEIPVNYAKDARSPELEKFIKHICMDERKERPIYEQTLQEYMGYLLYRSYPIKKYLVLDGGGDNGKTQYIIICIKLIGHENNVSISLQDLNERQFTLSKLYGKHACISDDLPKKALKLSGQIKQITGGSPLWADIKFSIKGIKFINYAKPIYACNELPLSDDISDAFFGRQLQITLTNKYIDPDEGEIDNIGVFARVNDYANSVLTTPENMPAILNYAIDGLKRLLTNNGFSLKETPEQKRQRWLMKTNPVHAFIQEQWELTSEEYYVTVEAFANQLNYYCKANDIPMMSRKKITLYMKDEGIEKAQRVIKGKSGIWCWLGIQSKKYPQLNFGGDNKKK